MRFPIRRFTVPSWTFAQGLLRNPPREIHFLRLTKSVAIVWDRADRK